MSIAYTQEYWQELLAAHEAQQTSAAFLEINDVAINYNTEYEAFEAMANARSPYGEAWYYDPVRNVNGEVIGMDYVQVPTSVENPPAVIDSNVANPVFTKNGERIRINGSGGGTPPNAFSKGAKTAGTGSSIASVAGKVGITIAVAGLGIKLGKLLSRGLYELGAGWQFNPDNWSSILEGDELEPFDKWAMRTLFGLDDNTGEITPYMPSDSLAAMYLTMLNSGAYATGDIEATYTGSYNVSGVPQPLQLFLSGQHFIITNTSGSAYFREVYFENCDYVVAYTTTSDPNSLSVFGLSLNNTPSYMERTSQTGSYYRTTGQYTITALDGSTVVKYVRYGYNISRGVVTGIPVNQASGNITDRKLVTVIYLGTVTQESPMEGVDDDPNATDIPNPNTITGTDLNTIDQQLRQNYPDLYNGEVYEDVPQQDGTNKRIKYVPVPMPNLADPTKPVTGDNHQNNPQIDPETNTDTQLKTIIDLITQLVTPDATPNPDVPDGTSDTPPTGTGNTPPVVTPTGSASSLWSVYNPTQAQVDAFGSWLWSSNFVDQLKKLFNDPMQAIIGIHKVFATPATGATQTIVCGYIDSEVPSKIVTAQYTTIDCGTVNLREYFGNVFDYAPFTEVSLYLPFIGIVKLDVGDVMRASIKVKYHVDVITGACLADVIVTRDNAGGVLYQYSGSAIVTYPISSGSYASAIGGILSIAGGIAATVMTGGAAAPAVLGAAAGMTHLHSDVQKSGSFTGAAGAMGGKIPYLIISRPQNGMPSRFEHLQGYPVNYYTELGSCTGHVRVRDVQVKGVDATDTELDMIRDALTQGIEI